MFDVVVLQWEVSKQNSLGEGETKTNQHVIIRVLIKRDITLPLVPTN